MTEDVNLAQADAADPGLVTDAMRDAGKDAARDAGLFATRADAEAIYRAMWAARPDGMGERGA